MNAVQPNTLHPDLDQLRRFLHGDLTDAACQELAEHLGDCTSCQDVLATESSADDLLQGLRQAVKAEPFADETPCRDMVARLAHAAPSSAATVPRGDTGVGQTPAELLVPVIATLPRDFGRYRLLSRLGQGGMGAVFVAEDTLLQRQVALKVALFQGGENGPLAQRFLREAQTAAGLQHDGICRILDYGICDGIHFFTMDLIRGVSLAAFVGQPLEPRRTAALICQVARALDATHRQGVIHRDLKPANIVLDEDGRPRVVDFGLARAVQDPSLTAPGMVAGTLQYMSPEQADGLEVGPASDIYSLGVVLYELLTDRLPYRGRSRSEILYGITHEPPEPLRCRRPELDPRLEALCLKALAKTPADRFATMADLAAALQGFLDSAGSETAPAGSTAIERAARSAAKPSGSDHRRLLAWSLGAVAALLVMTGLVWAVVALNRLGQSPGSVASLDPVPTSGTDGKPDSRKQVPIQPVGPFRGKGTLDIEVWRPVPGTKAGDALDLRDALPLRADDRVSVQVQLVDQPAYAYVIWIDPTGEAKPVYPWTPGDWASLPEQERISRLRRPEDELAYWTMKQVAGMETLVLLVRSTPWPADVDLKSLLEGLPLQPYQQRESAVWFENWHVVQDDARRGPNFFDEKRVHDPVLATQQLLRERLGKYCDYSRAVSFANQGSR